MLFRYSNQLSFYTCQPYKFVPLHNQNILYNIFKQKLMAVVRQKCFIDQEASLYLNRCDMGVFKIRRYRIIR